MTTPTQSAPGPAVRADGEHRLDPMRGIFVSLGLGAAAWSMIAGLVLGVRALLS